MYTLFGLKRISDKLSSHISNFAYLNNKIPFLVPLFSLHCEGGCDLGIAWCPVSEASRHSTLHSCSSQSGQYHSHKLLILLDPSLHFTPDLQSSVCILPPVCSLHFYTDHIKSQVDHIKSKNWSYQKLKVDHKKTWVDHIKSEKLTV